MSQARLRPILAAAAEAARAHPDWLAGDQLAVILADDEATVQTAWGFGTTSDLADCLDFLAGKARAAGPAAGRPLITRWQQQELDPLLDQAEGWTAEDWTAATDLIMAAYKLGRVHGRPPPGRLSRQPPLPEAGT